MYGIFPYIYHKKIQRSYMMTLSGERLRLIKSLCILVGCWPLFTGYVPISHMQHLGIRIFWKTAHPNPNNSYKVGPYHILMEL